MSKVTNQQVYDALTSCIEKRWKLRAASETGFDSTAAGCALCELFLIETYIGCEACPVYLRNGGKGCDAGSSYDKWAEAVFDNSTVAKKRAVIMLKELKAAKEHFFGGWK